MLKRIKKFIRIHDVIFGHKGKKVNFGHKGKNVILCDIG